MQMSPEISLATTARLLAAAARHLAKEAASLPSQLLLVFDGLLFALGGLWDRDVVQHDADERIGRLPRYPAPRASKQRAEFFSRVSHPLHLEAFPESSPTVRAS